MSFISLDLCARCGHRKAHHGNSVENSTNCWWTKDCKCEAHVERVPLLPRTLDQFEGQVWAAAYGAAFTEDAINQRDQIYRWADIDPLDAEWPWYVADRAVEEYRARVAHAMQLNEKARSM